MITPLTYAPYSKDVISSKNAFRYGTKLVSLQVIIEFGTGKCNLYR